MEWLILPTSILAFAFLMHGFPDIHIGSKNYYSNDKEKTK